MPNRIALRSLDPDMSLESPIKGLESYNECTVPSKINAGWECAFKALWRTERDRIIARFWSTVDQSGECWVCRLSAGDEYGHAQFTFRDHRKQYHCYAHRFAWVITRGAIPAGLFVLHHCDNGPCVRDSHFFLGDQDANMKDAAMKGRLSGPRRRRHDYSLSDLTSSIDSEVAR